ncbi:MAG: AmmeMemoRadiSam system protein B [Treponemataceae bacterium]|nr:AmmeMemoRadiSam system protein B [Treponemataceae bacterium]
MTNSIRTRGLPPGWYPDTKEAIQTFVEEHRQKNPPSFSCGAVVVPHAGWYFSGSLALHGLELLPKECKTLVVIGGHLSSRDVPRIMSRSGVETPLGILPVDQDFTHKIQEAIPWVEDEEVDNSVEVHLPLIHALFPSVKIVWLRLPPSFESYTIGTTVAHISCDLGVACGVVGSSDLTHYGPNYGFVPQGVGKRALGWVREVNDKMLLEAIQRRDPEEILNRARQDYSACSIGAVLGALGFADVGGYTHVRLVEYATSADRYPSHSFVGYGVVGFSSL